MRSTLLLGVVLCASGCHDPLHPSHGAPTAQLKGSTKGVVGNPLELDASGSVDPDGKLLTYRFSFDDGTPALITGSSTTRHVFARPGMFSVCVVVTDVEQLSDMACQTVQVAVLRVDVGPDQRPRDIAADRPADHTADKPLFDKPGLPDKTIADKPKLPDKTIADKPKPPDKTLPDKPKSPDKTVPDKPKSPDKTLLDKPKSPDKTLPDKKVIDQPPVVPDKKPSPDMASCFAAETSSGTGAAGYALKTVAPCGYDASIGGTKLNLYQKDTGKVSFLPFSFYFWGKGYVAVGISSNGYLQFPGTNPLVLDSHTAMPFPTATNPNNLIAALWSELKPTTESEVYVATVGQAPKRVYVMQWHVWAAAGTPTPTELTFSIFLYEGTNAIELQYLKLIGGSVAAGGLAGVGIENETGSAGVQHSYFKLDGVATTYGIRFVPK